MEPVSGAFTGGTMTNIGMERTPTKYPIKQSDSNVGSKRGRASDRNEPYMTQQEMDGQMEANVAGEPLILRLESTPATARNLARIRERVQSLNSRLVASNAPFRLRVV
jgi:hypothetical protein